LRDGTAAWLAQFEYQRLARLQFAGHGFLLQAAARDAVMAPAKAAT
jgi:hypothetical protein